MEPMTLGSPVGSPVSSPQMCPFPGSTLGVITSPTPNVNNSFYPAYLMGESPAGMGSRIPAGSVSPGRRARQFSSSNPISSPHSPQIGHEKFFHTQRIAGEKQAGPPSLGLMRGLAQSPSTRLQNSTFVEQHKIIGTPSSVPLGAQSPAYLNSSLTPAHLSQQATGQFTPTKDVLYGACSQIYSENSALDCLESTWVTVFGFPVASASYVLTQFAQLGTIVEQNLPGLGNWMHIKYQTKLQARKALAKNGKIFNGNIMIGVNVCAEQGLVSEKENTSFNTSAIFSPRDTPNKGFETTPKTHIRPLTQAYQAARADIEVMPGPNTPKKNEGLVSKAIQHLLGI